MEILKQGQFSPLSVEKQVAIIYLGSKGALSEVAISRVRDFELEFLQVLESKHKNVLDQLAKGNIGNEVTDVLDAVSKDLIPSFKK